MRAALLTELNHFEIHEMDKPTPHSHEVLVKVKAAGICGSDIHKMQSEWKYDLPMVMGHEFSGQVEAVGDEVEQVSVGDRVAIVPFLPCNKCIYCREGKYQLCEDYRMIGSHYYGGFEEYVVVPETNVLNIGEKISYEEAAMIEPLAVAAHGVMGLDPQVGDQVAVFGLGTIGILSVQWLRLAGVKRIIGIDIDPNKLEEAKKYGVTDTINPLEESLEEAVATLTNGLGVDIALECAGSKITEEQCLLITRKGGQIGYQGIAYTDVVLRQRAFENIFRREYTVKGFWNSYSAPFPGKEWTHSVEFIEAGKMNLKEMISHRFKLDEIQKAFNLTVNREESYNKVMIFPGEDK
ncbi:galactitol-1-phosphate 5-dehydrogenase [Streptococcus cuniculi]|uniref:Galactitol-1-phosphate 5-dehydrogenase n=1 Tax=Streptococcus cuniculi TaxID=1432788 RepID=A0A4Y9JEG6_9STRE|nr:galactitol-1-phosphate 5-dehydrogenase [Streptococcus cuniculi]MBF0777953.1 galactitol-1-phosphate 5-dehydrogenase [Streptococcus cuniculi]TFU98245.1 galactitol-1-phosphate 5-dehydrogenase [Streptococcus cuniculi]